MTESTRIDQVTMARAGYEGIAAAIPFIDRGLLSELFLVRPGGTFGSEWTLVRHSDCDPDRPDQGSSGVESLGTDEEDARRAFGQECREMALTADEAIRGYVVVGKTRSGKPIWFGNSEEAWSFAESEQVAAFLTTPAAAITALAAIPKMGNHYLGRDVDLTSFQAVDAHWLVKGVDAGVPDARRSPDGWRFAVRISGTEFLANSRHWARGTEIARATCFQTAGEARKHMAGEDKLVVVALQTVPGQINDLDRLERFEAARKHAMATFSPSLQDLPAGPFKA